MHSDTQTVTIEAAPDDVAADCMHPAPGVEAVAHPSVIAHAVAPSRRRGRDPRSVDQDHHPHRLVPRRRRVLDLGVPGRRQFHPELAAEPRRAGEPELPPVGAQLEDGLEDPHTKDADAGTLVAEVKLGCTLGMLSCLDRHHRMAYVLSDIFELPSNEGAYICDITPAAFRKRASRARAQLRAFTEAHCGLVDHSNACRCDRRVATAVKLGRVRPDELLFAETIEPTAAIAEMERLHDLASLMRSHPNYAAPARATEAVQRVINSGRFRILE